MFRTLSLLFKAYFFVHNLIPLFVQNLIPLFVQNLIPLFVQSFFVHNPNPLFSEYNPSFVFQNLIHIFGFQILVQFFQNFIPLFVQSFIPQHNGWKKLDPIFWLGDDVPFSILRYFISKHLPTSPKATYGMVEVMGVGKLINSFSFSDLKDIPAKVNFATWYTDFMQ